MHCNLSALAKEESRTIDIYMLLNTEILKKVIPGALHSLGSFKSIGVGFLRTLPAPFKTFLASSIGSLMLGVADTRSFLFQGCSEDQQYQCHLGTY